MWFRKSKPPEPPKRDPLDVVRELREMAFTRSASELRITPAPGRERVWSVIVETGYPGATVTLVAIADGTTSMYFSSGGGLIGAGEHAHVREVTQRLIAVAEKHLDLFATADARPHPAQDQVRFYARTFHDLRVAEGSVAEVTKQGHPLAPLFMAADEVVTAVREISESRQRGGPG